MPPEAIYRPGVARPAGEAVPARPALQAPAQSGRLPLPAGLLCPAVPSPAKPPPQPAGGSAGGGPSRSPQSVAEPAGQLGAEPFSPASPPDAWLSQSAAAGAAEPAPARDLFGSLSISGSHSQGPTAAELPPRLWAAAPEAAAEQQRPGLLGLGPDADDLRSMLAVSWP